MKVIYYRNAQYRPTTSKYPNSRVDYFTFNPYTIFKIGPVAVQSEFNYATGRYREYDNSTLGSDIRMEQMAGWVDATATFAPFYIGGTIAYVSGDDPNTKDVRGGWAL